jgi:hypothetical protein
MRTLGDCRAWAAAILLASLVGCFSPKQPACAFSCVVAPNRCPESYACGADGLCHRAGADSACTLTPPPPVDASADAATPGDASTGDESD